jgi:uncharacterized lipoprotein
MMAMLKRISLTFLSILCVILTGCSSIANSSTLRNRNFDYERVGIENFNQAIKTPQGMTTPAFTPRFIIPPGQNSYLPEPLTGLTPPDFNQVYEIPPVNVQPSF